MKYIIIGIVVILAGVMWIRFTNAAIDARMEYYADKCPVYMETMDGSVELVELKECNK